MALNVAVDIGGTFTDLIGYDESTGRVYQAKSSSTPGDLVQGIMRCLEKSGLDIGQLVNFIHGSTVAINTVIELKGARTALITTEGARDVYKIGRGNRPNAYDIFFKRPVPLEENVIGIRTVASSDLVDVTGPCRRYKGGARPF